METNEEIIYTIVLNDEGQYSVWPTTRKLPPGWESNGFTGSKEDCLAQIRTLWTDMRPLSLRQDMQNTQ